LDLTKVDAEAQVDKFGIRSDRRSRSIGQLAVASPTQTASPVVLFRAVPHDAGWNLQMPGQRDNKPLLICS
jgi:hypothetical protein